MTSREQSAPRADLHVHSSCSDGIFAPSKVLEHARRAGLSYLSITDHDSFEGYRRAAEYLADPVRDPRAYPVLVPGMELSCMHDGRDVHMLAYFATAPSPALAQAMDAARMQRVRRARRIVELLAADGFPISEDDLVSRGMSFNRVNVARLLFERGSIPSVDYFFSHLAGRGCHYHIERHEMEPALAIELIRESGGIPVIAHPAHYHVVDLIEPLSSEGLGGVEAYHASHALPVARELEELADRLGLLVTGGSDWHGDSTHAEHIGETRLPRHCLEKFLAADPRLHVEGN